MLKLPILNLRQFEEVANDFLSLIFFSRAFGAHEPLIANCFWSNAHAGLGFYIYNRPHLQSAATYQKILYAAFGSTVFNFGTLLLLVTVKELLPKCPFRRMTFGFLAGLCFLFAGKHYLDYVDKNSD